MITVSIAFPTLGNVYSRLMNSMKRYLPDDVYIMEQLDVFTPSKHLDCDIVITYNGNGSYYPQLAFVSPKAVISERADDITLSYYTDRDVLFTYNSDDIDWQLEAGHNIVLWPRPVDTELFYPRSIVKDKLVLSVGGHGVDGLLQRTDSIVDRLGARHLVMMHPSERGVLGLKAEFDYCYAIDPIDSIILAEYYSSSYYTVSFCPDYEVPGLPGVWSCGIETGVIEAIFCGSVPLVLRSMHTDYMHKWLDGLAVWIDPDNFDEEVEAILAGPYTPITKAQQVIALERFGAENVWKIFWDAIRKVLQ